MKNINIAPQADRYSENTLKYYNNLKNIGEFDDTLPNVGTGIVGSPLCGDVMKVQLFIGNNDIIQDVKFKVFGCVSAIASMELVSELLKGRSIDDALKLTNDEVADSLELTELKKHCSVLAKECIESAVDNYRSKQNKTDVMISASEKAVKEIKDLMSQHNSVGIIISVLSGGCAGIEYTLGYADEIPSDKKVFEYENIKFFYDPDMEILIKGAEIELMENTFGSGFVVTNKNHKGGCSNCTCGCFSNP
jgi:nitrogen fixation NifU-like protein